MSLLISLGLGYYFTVSLLFVPSNFCSSVPNFLEFLQINQIYLYLIHFVHSPDFSTVPLSSFLSVGDLVITRYVPGLLPSAYIIKL